MIPLQKGYVTLSLPWKGLAKGDSLASFLSSEMRLALWIYYE